MHRQSAQAECTQVGHYVGRHCWRGIFFLHVTICCCLRSFLHYVLLFSAQRKTLHGHRALRRLRQSFFYFEINASHLGLGAVNASIIIIIIIKYAEGCVVPKNMDNWSDINVELQACTLLGF